jgi:dTDP-4-dehydrorhamnose reductase
MKIAVVGCHGLLGNAFVRFWQGSEIETVPLDFPDSDITTRMMTLDLFREISPDVIINATGIMKMDWLEKHPNTARTVHVQGAANLREAARRTNAFLVHFSCAEIFGDAGKEETVPFSEGDIPHPLSIYAKTKLDGERAVLEYENHLILRTSALFGQTGKHTSGNMVESMLRALRRPEPLNIIDDIPTSPTWSDDLARAADFLIRGHFHGIFHVVNTETATPYEISQEILKLTGLKRDFRPIHAEDFGFTAPRGHHTMLKMDKYVQLENFPPMPSWQESLNRYLLSRAAF